MEIQKHKVLCKTFRHFRFLDSSIHHTASSGMCQTGPRVILQHVNEPKHTAIKNYLQKQGEQGVLQQMLWSPQVSNSRSQSWITWRDRRNWDSLNTQEPWPSAHFHCLFLELAVSLPTLSVLSTRSSNTLFVLVHHCVLLWSGYSYSMLIRSWFSLNLFH